MLTDCSAESCGDAGVYTFGYTSGSINLESKVCVEGCTFKQNVTGGVVAEGQQAVVTVKGCHSSQHDCAGYHATGKARMTVSSSVSEGDAQGCSADQGGQLTMEEVTVDGTIQSGHLPTPRALKRLRG